MNENDKNEVQVIEQEPRRDVAVQATGSTPADLLLYVMKSGGSIAEVREFMQLKREYEADEARKAYVADMAQFKLNPPTIVKDKTVTFKTDKGVTSYVHATIGNVTAAIVAGLAAHGFSHAWNTAQRDGQVIVTCKITHRFGHSEEVTLMAAPDSSGGKNGIQSIISAQTYLQRHTLLAATGLATHDQTDDDSEATGERKTEAPAKAKQPDTKPALIGPQFDNAKKAIASGKYTIEEARDYYALTPAQDAELAAAAPKGAAK